jgi:periplasmic protein TonB
MLATSQLESLPRDSGTYRRHALVFMGICLIHLLAIWVIWMGLADSSMRDAQNILQIDVILVDTSAKRPLLLPAVNLKAYQAIQVVTPQIDIPIAEDLPATIQVTSLQKELTSPPEQPAAMPAPPPVQLIPSVRPRPIYVPGGWERYPAESIRAHEAGRPTITICVSAAGTIDSVQLAESSGFPRLDQAAVDIGKEARFRPAMREGKPMPFCLPYRITFAIRNS